MNAKRYRAIDCAFVVGDRTELVLATDYAALEAENEKLLEILDSLIDQCFEGGIVDGADWQDSLEKDGILIPEPYSYERHGEPASGEFEEGDTIYVIAPKWLASISAARRKRDAALAAVEEEK